MPHSSEVGSMRGEPPCDCRGKFILLRSNAQERCQTLALCAAAYALGFLDCEDISARCMLTIFQFFATKTDASKLRMLNGSPAERLLKPITDYVESKGGRLHIRWGCR